MSQQSHPKRIVVVGGGITGLAAAYSLMRESRLARCPVELMLVEAASRLGGSIQTERHEGFLIECGADSFVTTKPWAVELVRELGLESQLVPTDARYRRAFVVRRGKLHLVPDGFVLLAPGRLWPMIKSPIFSWRGKLRMAMDLVLPRGPNRDDQSLADFVTRRLGREALERLVQPLMAGIYTADPKHLSTKATLKGLMPQLLEGGHPGSLIRALRREHRKRNQGPRVRGREPGVSGARYSLFVTLRDGLGTLVDQLARQISPTGIRLSTQVTRLVPRTPNAESRTPSKSLTPDPRHLNPYWGLELSDGTVCAADGVVLAIPSYRAAFLVASFDRSLADRLGAIPYASTAVVHLGYRREQIRHRLDGFGIVVPAIEDCSVLACSFSSVKFPGRAPSEHVLLRVFIGGALQPDLLERDDIAIQRLAHREIGELLDIDGQPVLTRVDRHARSMPQYAVGHLDRVAEIESRLSDWPGLQLAGNAYHGVGIPDCVRSGQTAARHLLEQWGNP